MTADPSPAPDRAASDHPPTDNPFVGSPEWIEACCLSMQQLAHDRRPIDAWTFLRQMEHPADEQILDLAYAEFVIRHRCGESPEPEQFLSRFPTVANDLSRQLTLDALLIAADELPTESDL